MAVTDKSVLKKSESSPSDDEASVDSLPEIVLDPVSRMYCPVCKQKMDTSTVKPFTEGHCPACGEMVMVQAKIGAYRILRLLAQGGMGAVYEGFDEALGRKVAIKVALIDGTRDREMLENFQREAQVVGKLNHPNVVKVYTCGEEKGLAYLAMELLPNGSLMGMIRGDGPLGVPFVMGVAFEVAEALEAAQVAGLLHGDIKPENILFDEKMHAKLVDFGLAAMSVSKNSYEVWGTPFYIAPEKILERTSNHKCDIYSLGATLYHTLVKHPPFQGADGTEVIKAALAGTAVPLSAVRPDVPPEVEAIVSRMMEKDVSKRYPNYKSIISDIKKYLATVPRENLRRTSAIMVQGTKKMKAHTRKIRIQGPVSSPSALLVDLSSKSSRLASGQKKSKTCTLPCVLIGGLVLLTVGGYFLREQFVGKERQKSHAQLQKPGPQQEKDVQKVLAQGTSQRGDRINFKEQPALQKMKLKAGESIILCAWNPKSRKEGHCVVEKLLIFRGDGKKGSSALVPLTTPIGDFSFKGLSKPERFPEIVAVMEPSQKKVGEKYEFVFPEAEGLVVRPASRGSGLVLAVYGPTTPNAKVDWAPAVVFTATETAEYSVEGNMWIWFDNDNDQLSWMIWRARLKQSPVTSHQ